MRVYRNYWNGAAQVPEREEVCLAEGGIMNLARLGLGLRLLRRACLILSPCLLWRMTLQSQTELFLQKLQKTEHIA